MSSLSIAAAGPSMLVVCKTGSTHEMRPLLLRR
jgi:hypothetical protein